MFLIFNEVNEIAKNIWTEEDEDIIKKYSNSMSIRELANILNKPYQAVSSKVGYYKKYKSKNLTCPTGKKYKKIKEDMNKQIINNVISNNMFLTENIKLEVKHKKHSKPSKKIKNEWNDIEIKYLIDNYLLKTRKELSRELGKTENNVRVKLMELDLRKTKKISKGYSWTSEEDKIILNISNLDMLTSKEKYDMLNQTLINRTELAIYRRIGFLNIRDKFKNGNISKLEYQIKKLLDQNNINYIQQFLIPNSLYKADFYIENLNLIIEVLGDYWHCNPKIYINGPKDDIQIRKINNDIKKKNHIKDLNYKVIYIWEYDINNNFEMVKDIIHKLNNANGRS